MPDDPTRSFPAEEDRPARTGPLDPTLDGVAVSPDAQDATLVSGSPRAAGALEPTGASVTAGAPAAERDRPLPERIGPYPIVSELGRGGMGVVYVARDPQLERSIALKVLPEALAADAGAFALFQREARLLASMNTPTIATIYSLESSQGSTFLTMELIPGTSLAQRIASGALGIDEALAVSRQVAVALEAAHRSGIVHLDLKPQNVMVTPEGGVKVLDFGLAMALGLASDASEEVRTLAGRQERVSGTPGYMSPEQIQAENVDARADVWAFGCILYECLAGRPAFPGGSVMEKLRATLDARADLGALPPETPASLRTLLERCLVPDPQRRLDSITPARRQLEEEIALRSLPARPARTETVPTNLPVPLAKFVGRAKQKAEIFALLGEHRWVTLTGVGGGGKTRLAIEAGHAELERSPDGAWWIELGPLPSGDLVPGAVASAVGLKDEAGRTPAQTLLEHLRPRNALLILDNCEHLVEAVAQIAHALLTSCPQLRILATSRAALGGEGEALYQVPPMSVPRGRAPALAELAAAEAVQLFVARAAAVQPAFALTEANAPAVVQICRRLDGIPLAIELAAARAKVLSPEEIARRLDDRFRLLTSGQRSALPHHQTLRALIDWSYDQLSETEQGLLRRLSLFADGWTLEAAEAVCGGDGIEDWEVLDLLSHLVDKSLVELDAESGPATGVARYRMLETIREYAHQLLLERKEGADILVRLRSYFLHEAEESEPLLTGPEQFRALARLEAEHENLRLARDLCHDPAADPDLGWRLAGALGRYWYMRGHWHEGRKAYADLIAQHGERPETPAVAHALNWAGNLAKLQGDYAPARALLEESLAIRRKLGKEPGIAAALNNLGNVLKDQGELDRARSLYEESLGLQRKLGHRAGIALSLNALGVLAHLQGDFARARAMHTESLEHRRALGDRSSVATSLNNLGAVAEALGEMEEAMGYLEESLAIRRELGDPWGSAAALINLGRLAEERRDLGRARSFYQDGLATLEELGDRHGIAAALNNLGRLAVWEGDRVCARAHFRDSLGRFRDLQERPPALAVLGELGLLAAEEGDAPLAVTLLAATSASRAPSDRPFASSDDERRIAALEALRSALGPAAFDRLWEEGRSRSLEEAVALALGEKLR